MIASSGAGSATLSMAYAAAVFADALMRAKSGESGVVSPPSTTFHLRKPLIPIIWIQTTPAFVESPLFKDQGVDYFASQVTFDKNGVSKIHDLGKLDASEQKLVDACLPELKKNIEKVRCFNLSLR